MAAIHCKQGRYPHILVVTFQRPHSFAIFNAAYLLTRGRTRGRTHKRTKTTFLYAVHVLSLQPASPEILSLFHRYNPGPGYSIFISTESVLSVRAEKFCGKNLVIHPPLERRLKQPHHWQPNQ